MMGTEISVAFRSMEPHRSFPSIGLREPDDLPAKNEKMVIDGEDWWVHHVEWSGEEKSILNVYLTDTHPNIMAWLGI